MRRKKKLDRLQLRSHDRGCALRGAEQSAFEYVLQVASGEKVKAEKAGFHDMAIFKQGVTL